MLHDKIELIKYKLLTSLSKHLYYENSKKHSMVLNTPTYKFVPFFLQNLIFFEIPYFPQIPYRQNHPIILIMFKLSIGKVALLLICIIVSSHSYSEDVASYMVYYAHCSDIYDKYIDEIKNWSFIFCKKAQKLSNIEDISVISTNDELAFTLYDKERNIIVVSFRATMVCYRSNIIRDMQAYQVPYGCTGCTVHGGFLDYYNDVQDTIRPNVQKLVKKHPSARVMITGVSLGAAIAAIAGYDMQSITQNIEVYTFGQPRLGNKKLIDSMNQRVTIYRIVYGTDPFPHLPARNSTVLTKSIAYYHPGTEIFYDTNGNFADELLGDNQYGSFSIINSKVNFDVCYHISYVNLFPTNQAFKETEELKAGNDDNNFFYSIENQSLEFQKGAIFLASLANSFPGCPSAPHPIESNCQRSVEGEEGNQVQESEM